MLFVVIHTHTPELCPSGDPEKARKTIDVLGQEAHALKAGVKVLGSYIAPPEHTIFFIIESESYEALVDFFRPQMKVGTLRVIPVSPLRSAVDKFK